MRTLKVTSGPAAGTSLQVEGEIVVGRDGADLTIEDSELSRHHAAIRPVEGGVEVEDLGSTNGTYVNGERIDGPKTLTANGTIGLGGTEIAVELSLPEVTRAREAPPAGPPRQAPSGGAGRTVLRVVTGTAPGTLIPVTKEPFVIGRGQSGMGMLDGDPELSRQHTSVSMVDGRVVVEDMGSRHGTFVNGNEIAAPTVVASGDSIYVGSTTLQVVSLGEDRPSGVSRAASSAVHKVRTAETSLLGSLAELAFKRPKRMLGATAVFFMFAAFFGGPVAGLLPSHPEPDPDVESTIATERLESAAGAELGVGLIALVRTGADVDSKAARDKVAGIVKTIEEEPRVERVIDFYSSDDAALVSKDRQSTWVGAVFKKGEIEDTDEAAEELQTELEKLDGVLVGGPGLTGPAVGEQVGKDIGKAEALAFPLLFIASIFIFRGVIAAMLPLFVGILTVFTTFLTLRIVNGLFTEISLFALNMVIALGLGLAIDYSLFIISRYREELAKAGPDAGMEPIRRTLKTAGRTVIFSSLTVAAALGSLLVFPQSFVYSMGIGGALCSLIAMIVSLTALPALLVALGPRVNALSPKRWREADRSVVDENGFWYRLSRGVMRRPLPVALVSAFLLILIGTAFLRIDFTGFDATILPKDTSVRKVDTALRTEFESNRGRQINLAVDAAPGDRAEVEGYAADLRQFPGVVAVEPPRRLSQALWQINVVPRNADLDQPTLDLVEEIREQPAPFPVAVAGPSAEFIDQQQSLGDHLPLGLALICLITVVVLFALTGSVLLPIKSLILNFLTVSAAFGLLVLIFQDGRLEGVLGYESQGAIEATQPLLLFALAFGLSTDYAVFLLTRIKEARDAGASESESVAIGLERTGRIVTAAALLFTIAIGAFATSDIIFIKELGVGTAFAVIIDATIVRALLVPSLMVMLGARNWWAPGPLRRLHSRIGISES